MAPRPNIKKDSRSSQYGNLYKYTKLPEKIDKVCQSWSKSQTKGRELHCHWQQTELRADLETRLKLPDHIAQTSLLSVKQTFSNKIKKILIWELTVPGEEHTEEAHERKKYKYDELLEKCKKNKNKNKWVVCKLYANRGWLKGFHCKISMQDPGRHWSERNQKKKKKRKAIETTIKTTERTAKWRWLKSSPWITNIEHT